MLPSNEIVTGDIERAYVRRVKEHHPGQSALYFIVIQTSLRDFYVNILYKAPKVHVSREGVCQLDTIASVCAQVEQEIFVQLPTSDVSP